MFGELASFSARIRIIGINPYVIPTKMALRLLFDQSGRETGPIQVCGTLNGFPFTQTLVRYQGKWRLYLNTPMRKGAGIDVGDIAEVSIAHDPRSRTIKMPAALKSALQKNGKAQSVFKGLPPSRRKEIVRYIVSLKSEAAVKRNIERAIRFLSGNGRFVGRDEP